MKTPEGKPSFEMNTADRLRNTDWPQYWKDRVFAASRYRLDERFVLRDGQPHPFAVICPGGAYRQIASYIEGVPIARRLNEYGFSAFILYYRVRRKARWPAPQEDLARAVGEILSRADQYMLTAENYSVWGFSAGGHLTATFGTDDAGYRRYGLPKPAVIVLSYPVISMKKGLTHRDTHDTLLGADAAEAMEDLTSVEEHVTSAFPPTYLWSGDGDTSVSPGNTRVMASALEAAGVPFRCDIFPGAGHGIGLGKGTSAEGWVDRAVSLWLDAIRAADPAFPPNGTGPFQ